mgnify:CR=1 FL=1
MDQSCLEVLEEFSTHGFAKVQLRSLGELQKVRRMYAELVHKLSDQDSMEACLSAALERFHELPLPTGLNTFRLRLISELNDIACFNSQLFLDPLPTIVEHLLGPDLLIQRHVNLVIQRPRDVDNAELHSDFPTNSAFEVVVWIPMVDCDKSNGMYLQNLAQTRAMINELEESEGKSWARVKAKVEEDAIAVPVSFGECLIFMTPLFHGSKVNTSNVTRTSFNFRLKGMFSPCGKKDPFNFWEIAKISAFTKTALSF